MTPADFAAFSNNAITFTGIVYALALLAHITEYALGRKLPVTSESRTQPVASVEREREPVAAGVAAPPAPEDERAGPDTGPDTGQEDDPDRELSVEKFGRIGVALTMVACLLHLSGLVSRGLAADPVRVPWGNMYEFTLAGTLGVTVMYLVLLRRYRLRWMGLLVTAFEVVALMAAGLLLYVPAGPLVPALHSYWLAIHVTAAIIAAGAFTVGGMASILFLVRERAERRGTLKRTGYVARLPEASVLDRVAYRVHAFGFPIWTFAALVAGPIWAEYAWGRYWGWDPKEVWAFITWVVYAAYLHARATAGWKGRAAAVIALVGFATVLFNFVGINLFGSGLHSYSGLD